MKIAQRILAQARAEVEALAEANARLHNPPTLFNAPIAQCSAFDAGERFDTPLPAEPSRLPGTVFESYFDDEERAEEHIESQMDAADPDPRWTANREVRFAVKAYSTFAEAQATEMTGIEAEPVRESVLEEWDPKVYSWQTIARKYWATFWAYLTATKITTRTVKVFTILVDRANCGVIVQRNNRFSPTGRKTVWREGVGDLKSAVERARLFEAKARERGDNVKLITFPGRERKLIILDGTKVIYRPDRKGDKEHGRKTYTTRKEAGEAVQNIYAWAQAQGFAVRVWNKPVQSKTDQPSIHLLGVSDD